MKSWATFARRSLAASKRDFGVRCDQERGTRGGEQTADDRVADLRTRYGRTPTAVLRHLDPGQVFLDLVLDGVFTPAA